MRRSGEFVEAGATIVGRIWEPCDGETVRSHTHGAGKVFWNVPLKDVLAGMGVAPDFAAQSQSNENRDIDYIHRRTETEELYFVSNISHEHRSAICRLRVSDERVPSFWHPNDGSVRASTVCQKGEGVTRLTVELPPGPSVSAVFRKEKREDHLAAATPPTTETNAIDMLCIEDDRATERVWRPGN